MWQGSWRRSIERSSSGMANGSAGLSLLNLWFLSLGTLLPTMPFPVWSLGREDSPMILFYSELPQKEHRTANQEPVPCWSAFTSCVTHGQVAIAPGHPILTWERKGLNWLILRSCFALNSKPGQTRDMAKALTFLQDARISSFAFPTFFFQKCL